MAAAGWFLGGLGVNGADGPSPVERADPVGEILSKGARLSALGAGAAFGTLDFGGTVRHDWAVAHLQHGIVVSDRLGADGWLSGRLVLGGEFLLGWQYQPDSGVLFGAAPLIRYLFETSERWKPFLEAGAGIALTDIGEPSFGGKLQFSPQGGVGFYWFLKPDLAIGVQQRFIHYSNGSIRSPNAGLNQHVSMISLARFY